jgi:hypothetical protein
MRSLEDAVLEIEHALEPAPKAAPRLMAEYVDDVPAAARCAIRAKLGEIREGIGWVNDRFGLRRESISTRRRLSARLSLLAVELAECSARRLRGFGEVASDERNALDQIISRLEEMVNDLNRLVRGDD